MKVAGVKLKGKEKFTKKRINMVQLDASHLKKPDWIRVRSPNIENYGSFMRVKRILRDHQLHTVCEEASCPNISECFSHGTATFMIMGDICTRRCPFCDVAHGRPLPLDKSEPINLANAVAELKLRHLVITSVNRDDLVDGGAHHFVACIREIRARLSGIIIEVLVPDFRKHATVAIQALKQQQPDIVNHNLETVPSLYKFVRPGADYAQSLDLLAAFKATFDHTVRTKSGIMLGVGETIDEVITLLRDLRTAQVDMVTLGQYLQPSPYHLPVVRFVHPDEFIALRDVALDLGFAHVASGPLVRSSYHAESQLL